MGNSCARELARSMLQPWLYSSCIPDATRYIVPFTLKQTGSITTGTGGSCYAIFAGLQPDAFLYAATAGTASTLAVAGSWSLASANATLVSQYNAYRVVSASIRCWYTGNTLNDSGVVVCGQLSAEVPVNSFNGADVNTLAASSTAYRISALREGAIITWRPQDLNEQATLYDVDNVAQAAGSTLDHSYLYIAGFGAAAAGASSLQYEITVNMEGQLGSQTYMPGGQTPTTQPAEPGWYETVGNMIRNVPAYATPVTEYASAALGVYQALRGNPNGVRRITSNNRIEL